jgi:uncharacterized protein
MEKELRVAAIVGLVQNAPSKLGKTQVQKLVYFAQKAGVPLEYRYEIYHYGPYSFELSHDLSSLDGLGVLNIQNDPSGYGFDVSVGKFAERFRLDQKYQKKIDKVVNTFATNTPAQLEVKATIHFVKSVLQKKTVATKIRPEVIQKVHALKPRFSQDFIKKCYSDLQQAKWV